RRILPEPVQRLTHARERAGFAYGPARLLTGEGEAALITVGPRPALHAPSGAIAGQQQCLGGLCRRAAVVGIEVQGRLGRELEMVGGPGAVTALQQALGDQAVQAQPLALGQAPRRDLFPRGLAVLPVAGGGLSR